MLARLSLLGCLGFGACGTEPGAFNGDLGTWGDRGHGLDGGDRDGSTGVRPDGSSPTSDGGSPVQDGGSDCAARPPLPMALRAVPPALSLAPGRTENLRFQAQFESGGWLTVSSESLERVQSEAPGVVQVQLDPPAVVLRGLEAGVARVSAKYKCQQATADVWVGASPGVVIDGSQSGGISLQTLPDSVGTSSVVPLPDGRFARFFHVPAGARYAAEFRSPIHRDLSVFTALELRFWTEMADPAAALVRVGVGASSGPRWVRASLPPAITSTRSFIPIIRPGAYAAEDVLFTLEVASSPTEQTRLWFERVAWTRPDPPVAAQVEPDFPARSVRVGERFRLPGTMGWDAPPFVAHLASGLFDWSPDRPTRVMELESGQFQAEEPGIVQFDSGAFPGVRSSIEILP